VPGDALPLRPDADDPQRPRADREGGQATGISLDEAPRGYEDSDHGAAKKFVPNPHGLIKA
jgi:hypothetical protein